MANRTLGVVNFRDDYYRDSFARIVIIFALILTAILSVVGVSVYLHLNIPKPVSFRVGDDWRAVAPVSVDQPYLSHPELLQWVISVVPYVFNYDFVNYQDELQANQRYFTQEGWRQFLNQVNIYANIKTIQAEKYFINGSPAAGPEIQNEGPLTGRYAWWVKMPITLKYIGVNRNSTRTLSLQILVVRVPTLNNLSGVGIENMLVTPMGSNNPLFQ